MSSTREHLAFSSRVMVAMAVIAAVLVAAPVCAAEGESHIVQEAGEHSFEGARQYAELVQEGPRVSEGEIDADVESAMRDAVRDLIASTTHRAVKTGQAAGLDLQAVQASVRHALQGVRAQISPAFVETAAKRKAIVVAKDHAKAAAARAAKDGASAIEQAHIARTTASDVARAFAQIAHESGLKMALDEVELLQESSRNLDLTATSEFGLAATTPTAAPNAAARAAIDAAAKEGVNKGVDSAQDVARTQATKAGLNQAETAALEKQAASAVKKAAAELEHVSSPTPTDNAAADADAYAAGDTGGISADEAADKGKEAAKKAVLAKYEKIAAQEKAKARTALEAAAREEAAAAKYVNNVATNSLARGIYQDVSTKNLKRAAEKATDASDKVEAAVKDAVAKAIRQKDRLKRANEKVEKAGDDARKEAEEKNEASRQQAYDMKSARERKEKETVREVAAKKKQANEAAHKAISRVVTAAGTKASRKAARLNAASIQTDFLTSACHRHAQHSMRLAGEEAKNKAQARGLSNTAQQEAEVAALNTAKSQVIQDVVANAVRRQAHLSAVTAIKHAKGRGLSNSDQLAAARKAWKTAEPEIKGYCTPAATSAATTESSNPGQPPERIDEDAFVTKAVKTMKDAVSQACVAATKPVVESGSKLAAQHDADYDFQKLKGDVEAAKVCNATTALYTTNAEKKSKEMVARSFEESTTSKENSKEFLNKMRQTTADKVKRSEEEAEDKANEHAEKQCQKAKQSAADSAKHSAARSAVEAAEKEQAELKGKEAYDQAYNEAIQDGLSETRAKQLATEAKNQAYAVTKAQTQEATQDLAPPAPPTAEDLMLLEKELTHFTKIASTKRAKEAQAKIDLKHSNAAAVQSAKAMSIEATDAETDVKTVTAEVSRMRRAVAAQELAVPEELMATDEMFDIGLSEEEKGVRQRALATLIATAVKQLHHLGGSIPAEEHVAKLQGQLHSANAHISELEARAELACPMPQNPK